MSADPQEVAPQVPELRPSLRLIPGALATEQTVEIVPDFATIPEDEFKAYVQGLVGTGGTPDELRALREVNSNLSMAMSKYLIAEPTPESALLLDKLYKRKLWIKGYIDDRLPPEYFDNLRSR